MKLNKKAIIGIIVLVAACGVGIARLLGYEVEPVCAVAPNLCSGQLPEVEFENVPDAGVE